MCKRSHFESAPTLFETEAAIQIQCRCRHLIVELQQQFLGAISILQHPLWIAPCWTTPHPTKSGEPLSREKSLPFYSLVPNATPESVSMAKVVFVSGVPLSELETETPLQYGLDDTVEFHYRTIDSTYPLFYGKELRQNARRSDC
jgi:hypothetical protein